MSIAAATKAMGTAYRPHTNSKSIYNYGLSALSPARVALLRLAGRGNVALLQCFRDRDYSDLRGAGLPFIMDNAFTKIDNSLLYHLFHLNPFKGGVLCHA
jgi:hypothetical protein